MLASIIFVFCLLAGRSMASNKDKELQMWFIQNALECNKEFPVSIQEFEQLKKHKVPDTRNAKCLQLCVFKRIKWADDKGTFDDEEAYRLSQKEYKDPAKLENAKKLYAICKKENEEEFTGADAACERGAALAKCLTENSIKLGFIYS